MSPLTWAGAAGAVTAGVLLIAKKAQAREIVSKPTPAPSEPVYGETTRVALAVPSGWRRVTNAEVGALPELASAAVSLRNTPGFTSMQYGTLSPFVASDGRTYATWIEQHHHEPGSPAKPWGLHHGVTLLVRLDGW